MEKKWINDGKFIELSEDEVKALSTDQLGEYTGAKHKNDSDILITNFEEKMSAMKKDFLTSEEIEKIKDDFNKSIKGLPIEALNKYTETIDKLSKDLTSVSDATAEIKEIALKQGTELKSLVEQNKHSIPDVRQKSNREDHLKALIRNAFASSEFEEFEGRGFKGVSNKMFLDQKNGKIELKDTATKATVGMAAHTGSVMISEVSDIVTDDSPTRRMHVRDLINVGMTDQAQIVAGQVYDFSDALTLGAVMLAENDVAPESVFKSKEKTWGLKRIANSMRISKRYFKTNGLQWVIDKVLSKLPDAVLFQEDRQLLFGDGVGNNVKGVANDAQAFNLAPNTYVATSFASVATYNGGLQALITFAAVHGMKNGDNLTIANATEATYNAAHVSVEVINTTQVIIDLAYVVEADVSAWTGSSTSPFYNAIDLAQEYDVLAISDAILEAGEYSASGHVIHPSQATQIGELKDTQGDYLNIAKDSSGRIVGVNGKPVIHTTAMPFGKFMSGDFSRNGLELKEFSPLSVQFLEDVDSAKKNEIVVLIEEEIIFPIYNPFWFIFGKFVPAKAQLETA